MIFQDSGPGLDPGRPVRRCGGNYSAYVPDLPGCVATGATVAAVESEIRDAIHFHIDGLRADGIDVPQPTSIAQYVETQVGPRKKLPSQSHP